MRTIRTTLADDVVAAEAVDVVVEDVDKEDVDKVVKAAADEKKLVLEAHPPVTVATLKWMLLTQTMTTTTPSIC